MSRQATPFVGAAFAVDAWPRLVAPALKSAARRQTAKPATAKPATAKPAAMGDAADAGRQAGPAGELDQRDADAARAHDRRRHHADRRAGAEDRRPRAVVEEYRDKASDPNRPAPPKGGEAGRLAAPGERSFIEQIAEAAGGGGGRLQRFLAGSRIEGDPDRRRRAQLDHHRSAERPDSRAHRPRQEADGRDRRAQPKYGEFDHPEMRPLADRCLLSFGSNAGPPMLPNYFYNNNYTIVQTPDHIVILARDGARHPHHPHEREVPHQFAQPAVAGRFDRPLGRRHARRRDHQHSSDAARAERASCGRTAARARSSRSPSDSRAPDRTRSSIASRWRIRRCSPRRSPASCRSRRSTRWSTSTRATKATTR